MPSPAGRPCASPEYPIHPDPSAMVKQFGRARSVTSRGRTSPSLYVAGSTPKLTARSAIGAASRMNGGAGQPMRVAQTWRRSAAAIDHRPLIASGCAQAGLGGDHIRVRAGRLGRRPDQTTTPSCARAAGDRGGRRRRRPGVEPTEPRADPSLAAVGAAHTPSRRTSPSSSSAAPWGARPRGRAGARALRGPGGPVGAPRWGPRRPRRPAGNARRHHAAGKRARHRQHHAGAR